jgi:hypothetical protein
MTRIGEPYKCDVCGKHRDADANHWWLVWIYTLADGRSQALEMQPWNDTLAREPGMGHACGLEHALLLAGRGAQDVLEAAMREKSHGKTA